nr:Putative AC transposase [Cajanus cajan]
MTEPAASRGDGGGAQPIGQPTVIAEAVETNPTATLPINTRKRKLNASGSQKTSIVWEHFKTISENESKEKMAECNHCGKRYRCDPKIHGTSSLLNHIGKCPKYPNAIINDPNQTSLTLKRDVSGLTVVSQRYNVEACRRALIVFIILDEQPFRVVEGEGFKHFCRQLQPQFIVPSRHTIARLCFQFYMDEKHKLKAFFKSNCARVALTTDCWTSIQNLNYLALTTHFIDNDWKYQKRIISFSIVPNHKGETIGKKVEEVLKEWGLRNVSTITVDNASANDVAVTYLKKRFKNMGGLVMDGQFFHMRCCAHILNLVVNDGLKDVHNSIANIRTAVRFVRSSPQRLAKFKECVEFSKIECKKLLCLDVPTRWNSTYMMLDAAEKFQVAFEKLDFEDSSYLEVFGIAGPPTTIDWENVRAFLKFLKIFYEATKVFSTSSHVSLHVAFHQLSSIYFELKQSNMNLNTILAMMGFNMKQKYDKYWGNINNINQLLYFGVIFDPRYKFEFVDWSFKEMYLDDANFDENLSTSLKENLFHMYNWYKTGYEKQNESAQSSHDSTFCVSHSETSVFVENSSYLARKDAFKKHLREKKFY